MSCVSCGWPTLCTQVSPHPLTDRSSNNSPPEMFTTTAMLSKYAPHWPCLDDGHVSALAMSVALAALDMSRSAMESKYRAAAAEEEEEAAQHAAACKNNHLCLCLCTLPSALFALSLIRYGSVSNCLCAEMWKFCSISLGMSIVGGGG